MVDHATFRTMEMMRFTVPLAALSALVLVLTVTPAARAGTLTQEGMQVVFTAGSGEANSITVRADALGGPAYFELRDAGAPLPVGGAAAACSDLPPTDAGPGLRCPAALATTLTLNLGDADDAADVREAPSTIVNGEAGDDRLVGQWLDGGPGDDTLRAPARNGRLAGGDGRDTLISERGIALNAGAGDDVVEAANGGVDQIVCGEGLDAVRFDDFEVLPGDCERPTSVATDTELVSGPAITQVDALDGVTAWLQDGRLITSRAGAPPRASAGLPAGLTGLDLGRDDKGRVVALVSRCPQDPRRSCGFAQYDVPEGRRERPGALAPPGCGSRAAARWRSGVATWALCRHRPSGLYVRTGGRWQRLLRADGAGRPRRAADVDLRGTAVAVQGWEDTGVTAGVLWLGDAGPRRCIRGVARVAPEGDTPGGHVAGAQLVGGALVALANDGVGEEYGGHGSALRISFSNSCRPGDRRAVALPRDGRSVAAAGGALLYVLEGVGGIRIRPAAF